ncbi:hypothetical protein FRC00_010782, partial [Tulasnella sp. 408]
MFKKRNFKASTRKREVEEEEPEVDNKSEDEQKEDLPIEDLIALRKLRKSKQGIELQKLTQGDTKKKRKKRDDEEEPQYGIRKPNEQANADHEEEIDEGDEEAKTRRLVRSNNFTQQTNKLDVDKHMMAYIEENLKAIRGEGSEQKQEDDAPHDPLAQLYQIDDRYKIQKKDLDEGSVTNSMAMLTAIPEVDLGIDVRLKNIEETEKAKRLVEEGKRARHDNPDDDVAHLAATRFYRPHQQVASDAEALRNAKLEAMGIPVPEPRPRTDRKEMATDEVKVRALVICNANLATICKHYNMQEKLKGAAAQRMTLLKSEQVQADLFESYIAGVYLDRGFDETK